MQKIKNVKTNSSFTIFANNIDRAKIKILTWQVNVCFYADFEQGVGTKGTLPYTFLPAIKEESNPTSNFASDWTW